MADPTRARKLAVRIKEIVATMVEGQIKDPRLGMVTVTDVRVTNDLHDATIFYTVYGDEQAREDSAAALTSAAGIIRSNIGRLTGLKFTPTVAFVLDALPDTAKHIDDLVAVAHAADAELAAVREGARYAAGENPYKEPKVRTPQGDEDDDADEDEA